MKKVISGKVYDTDTAKRVGFWGNGYNTTDFRRVEEQLYQKKTGEFFLYCWGGARSKYGKWHGNEGGSGELIKPFDEEQAKEWAETCLDGDSYMAIFGDPEANSRSTCAFSMSERVKNSLKAASESTGKSMSSIVEAAMAEWLSKHK